MLGISFGFLATFLISWVVLEKVFSPERKVSRRLNQLSIYNQPTMDPDEEEPTFSERVVRPFFKNALQLIYRYSPAGMVDNIKRRLIYAGNPKGLDADKFLSLKVIVLVLTFLFFALLFWLPLFSMAKVFMFGLILTPLSFFLPDLWLTNRIEKRQKAIRLALPDTLDLLTIGVEAGLAFDAALAKVIKNGIGPLGEEFAKTLHSMQVGASRKEALKDLASRTMVADFQTFIMAMIQADIFGISIGQVLRTQAREMRVKRRQHAEEKAMKAPVKIVFPVVLCIFPALMVVIVGPALIRVITSLMMVP